MKTIKEVNQQLNAEMLLNDFSAKSKKIIQLFKDCVFYLETNPREDFLKSEFVRIKKLVASINLNKPVLGVSENVKIYRKRVAAWRADNELLKNKRHLKWLKYLLS